MQPQAARDFYALQQRVANTTANEARRIWRRGMGDDFDSSWRRTGPSILNVLVEGQSQMIGGAARYVPQVLDELRIPDRPAGDLVADSLIGVASDGRPLDTLAGQAVVTAKVVIGDGGTTQQGLAAGADFMHLMAMLQVADAARVAVGIGTASRRNLSGHVRVLNPPVCQRCAILGGRFYRWSAGFDRHPGDDCTMMPVSTEAEARSAGVINSPEALYRAGGIKDITEAQAEAISEGAKLQDVVNVYRGMGTTVTERLPSTRRLHLASKAARAEDAARRQASIAAGHPDLLAPFAHLPRATGVARLTPEGIYRIAGSDRNEAIRLLRREGYIT